MDSRKIRVEEKTRQAIEELAGQDLAAAASVLRVGRIEVVEQGVDTAALQLERGFHQEKFKIVLNAEFCDRPQRDLQAVLLHELLHHVMRHLQEEQPGSNKLLCNVVQDAFINRTIHLTNQKLSGFMEEYYAEDEMPVLMLRPNSKPQKPEDKDLYQDLYQGSLTERDLYQALEDKVPDQQLSEIQLLGSHSDGEEDEEEGPAIELPEAGQILDEIIEQLNRQQQGEEAGRLRESSRRMAEIQQAKRRSEVEQAFKRALCSNLGGAEGQHGERDGEHRQVIMPQQAHRADLYWMLAGLEPLLWRSPDHSGQGGCAVYIDVSGSMNNLIELVYSSCLALDKLLAPDLYLFSSGVNQISLDELRQGLIETSWGTDFNCVARHLSENPEIRKAVIFTDGYAAMSERMVQKLSSGRQQLIGVLTPGGSRDNMGFCSELFEMPPESLRPGSAGTDGFPARQAPI